MPKPVTRKAKNSAEGKARDFHQIPSTRKKGNPTTAPRGTRKREEEKTKSLG